MNLIRLCSVSKLPPYLWVTSGWLYIHVFVYCMSYVMC